MLVYRRVHRIVMGYDTKVHESHNCFPCGKLWYINHAKNIYLYIYMHYTMVNAPKTNIYWLIVVLNAIIIYMPQKLGI